MISGAQDKQIRVWSRTLGETLRVLSGHDGFVRRVFFLENDEYFVSCGGAHIKLWSRSTGVCVKAITVPLETGEKNVAKTIANMPQDNDKPISVNAPQGDAVRCICLARPRSIDSNLSNSEEQLELEELEFSEIISTTNESRRLSLWRLSPSLPAGPLERTAKGHLLPVISAVAVSSKWVFSGGDGKVICMWDLETAKCVRRMYGHSGFVNALAYYENQVKADEILVSASADKSLKVWDVKTSISGDKTNPARLQNPMDLVIFSPSGDAQVEEVNTGILTLSGHRRSVLCCAVGSADSPATNHHRALIYSGSEDADLRTTFWQNLWYFPEGK